MPADRSITPPPPLSRFVSRWDLLRLWSLGALALLTRALEFLDNQQMFWILTALTLPDAAARTWTAVKTMKG